MEVYSGRWERGEVAMNLDLSLLLLIPVLTAAAVPPHFELVSTVHCLFWLNASTLFTINCISTSECIVCSDSPPLTFWSACGLSVLTPHPSLSGVHVHCLFGLMIPCCTPHYCILSEWLTQKYISTAHPPSLCIILLWQHWSIFYHTAF